MAVHQPLATTEDRHTNLRLKSGELGAPQHRVCRTQNCVPSWAQHDRLPEVRNCSMGRRLTGALASAVIAVSVGCLAGCGTPTSPSPLTDQSVFPAVKSSAYGLIAANPAITDQIELSTNRLPTGGPLHATLEVVNHSSGPIALSKTCKSDMLGVLGNKSIPPRFSFRNTCESKKVVLRPGTNRWPLHVMTTYLYCTGPNGSRPCLKGGGFPPLPRGGYYMVLIGSGLPLPAPRPVPVSLT